MSAEPVRPPVAFVEERLGAARPLRAMLRYVFPDHWSFLLGEIALYCFVVLVATGVFLALHFVPSDAETVYHGAYAPLAGRQMGEQYASALRIVFDVPAGNLIRQTHHWAADVFVAAIVLHVIRVILTGAFRKPRELNHMIGVTMLMVAVLEGFAGYSLIDDLMSGMGLAIAYSVALSVPVLGTSGAFLIWGDQYPGASSFWPRLEIAHALLLPALLATLMAVHLAMIARQHHTQFPGRGRTERRLVGTPMWPGYALRSIGLLLATAAMLLALGGLFQINPIWEWGPYTPDLSTNGAQPDWYLGWLIGALRLMPPLEIHLGTYTLVASPFWGGVLFPLVVFGVLYAWPALDRRRWGGDRRHNLLDRPRDNPRRTAAAVAFLTWVLIIFAAGATDRLYVQSAISYTGQVWAFRIGAIVVPLLAYRFVRRLCLALLARESAAERG